MFLGYYKRRNCIFLDCLPFPNKKNVIYIQFYMDHLRGYHNFFSLSEIYHFDN